MHTQAKLASFPAGLVAEDIYLQYIHVYIHTDMHTQAKVASFPAGLDAEDFVSAFSSAKFDKCDDELQELRDMIASLKKETEELQVCMRACIRLYIRV
jgi:hypothetical protein